jgi:acetylglutamate kinase
MKTTQDIIVRLLGNIGSRKEVEQYLRHYASVEAPKFAVIKVSGSVIDQSLDMLASSLSFLAAVGLVPIVVHGAGAQIERALEDAQIDAPIVGDGLWRMTPQVLDVARRTLLATGASIVDALENLGTRARPYTSGVLEVTTRDDERVGLTAEVRRVADGSLAAAARAGIIPVVSPFGETAGGQIAIVHADVVAREIALALRPHKIVFLSSRGGLVDTDGRLLSAVNLAEDYEPVLADGGLTEPSRHELTQIHGLLAELPATTSVSITSPEHLARELFTHRGAGTLVRRGERVRALPSFDEIDAARLRALLEQCFGRKLKKDYFKTKEPFRVYLAESYRATAILTHEEGVPYLDKFAVTPEAQGEGIGASIWQRMLREVPKLFWRARAANPVNAWYAQQADGLYKTDEWWVFWCGMTDFSEIEACVKRALAMPATLKGSAPEAQGVEAQA